MVLENNMGKWSRIKVGDRYNTIYGDEVTVIEYINCANVKIKFKAIGNERYCTSTALLCGRVRNFLSKSVFGVGFFGNGKYKSSYGGNSTQEYRTWLGMMERCYDKTFHEMYPNYANCSVCPEWHNFQYFAEWVQSATGFKEKDEKGKIYHLDKDLLIADNTQYGPTTCCFLPFQINIALKASKRNKKVDLPCGVYLSSSGSLYTSCISKYGIVYSLGCFKNVEDAVNTYNRNKSEYLRDLAERYKETISKHAYDVLLKYDPSNRDAYNFKGT